MCRALCSNVESEQERCQSTICAASCTIWVQHDRDVSQNPGHMLNFLEKETSTVHHTAFAWLKISNNRILHVLKFLNVYT